MTLKPEMPWLDDPGMNRPDRHLMDFFSLHAKEGVIHFLAPNRF
jgi:hypothetical protein